MDNVKSFTMAKGTIHLIDDGSRFKYGTKQRISSEYVATVKGRGHNECVYAGPVNAMGAFALAWGCEQNNVNATLFLVGPQIPPQAKGFSKLVTIKLMHCSLYEAQQAAENYVKESKTRYLVPFGINDPLYVDLLKRALQNVSGLNPKRMWVAVGSGTLLSILLQIYPKTIFMCVQVGKTLNFHDPRIVLFRAPEKFTASAEIKPPYNSLDNYDAKIWRFVLSDGQDGDYIWNVAANIL